MIHCNMYICCSKNLRLGGMCSLLWNPSDSTHPLVFSTMSGHIGSLPREWVWSSVTGSEETSSNSAMKEYDPLVDDSLLMEVSLSGYHDNLLWLPLVTTIICYGCHWLP